MNAWTNENDSCRKSSSRLVRNIIVRIINNSTLKKVEKKDIVERNDHDIIRRPLVIPAILGLFSVLLGRRAAYAIPIDIF